MMWRGIRQAARRFVADGGAARCARLGAMGLLVCRALPVAAQAPAGARDTLQLRLTADSLRTTGRDSAAAGMAFVQLGVEYESKLDAPQAARAFEQASALAAATGDSVTLADALQASGLLQRHALVAEGLRVGIWGKLRPPETLLRARDRIELYRSLTVDPKEARRLRYKRNKAATTTT